MFELVPIERGGRKSVWVIIRLAEIEVLYHNIANCRDYCIFGNICWTRAYAARGGFYYHISCFCKLDISIQSLMDNVIVNKS